MDSTSIPPDYNPLQDPTYMSSAMRLFFKQKLESMLAIHITRERKIASSLLDNPDREADIVDQGSNETLHNNDFALHDYDDTMRIRIEHALRRIEEGTYGFCEETGRPIGVQRLLSIPYTTVCVDIQQTKEEETD